MPCFIGQKSCRQFAIMGVVDDKIKIHWYTFCNFYVSIVYTGYGKGSHIKLYIMSTRNFKWLLQATPLVFMYILRFLKQCRASAFKQTLYNNLCVSFYLHIQLASTYSLLPLQEIIKWLRWTCKSWSSHWSYYWTYLHTTDSQKKGIITQ